MSDYTEHLISMAGGDGEPDLDAIQARADSATEGPWELVAGSLHQPIIYSDGTGLDIAIMDNRDGIDSDANFIAHARTDVPALLAVVRSQQAKIERVEALHTFAHTDVEPWATGYRYSGDHCGFDGEHWPCATIAALTATEGAV